MRITRTCRQLWVTLLVFLACASTAYARAHAETKDYTYGIEINGELCGYADVHVEHVENPPNGDEPYLLLEQKTVISVVALGLNVDQQNFITFHVDPGTWHYRYFAARFQADEVDLRREVVIKGDTAYCTSSDTDDVREVELPADVVLANNLYLHHARRDFVEGGVEHAGYLMLDSANVDAPLQTVEFTKVGTETLETTSGSFEVFVVDTLNKATGAKSRLWVSNADGMVVKVTQPNGTAIMLADASIKEKVQRVNADDTIMAAAETDITDVHAIAHMKVRASLEPVGVWFDVPSLKVPGQSFEGTVVDNRIEGIFTIEHPRYDGTNAPPYPPNFEKGDALAKYLEAGGLIESDDPVLQEKAKEIAEGSADSWEAAVRLSRWVADNIGYEIPGGVFARKVYDMRVGECGGHSILLAAFCRAVGIPARAVWGCMYSPMGGGVFGQHAWTEIYMGEAGWIPVDSTAHQVDFVDSGHIRLGLFGDSGLTGIALGARSMEVLDYRLDTGREGGEVSAAGKYVEYAGLYDPPDGSDPFRVLVKNGRLAVDIPGKVVLPLNDPDEVGRWMCSLTNLLYCEFSRDETGEVVSMDLHEIVRMRRRSDPDAMPGDVSEELSRYLGGYFLPQANAEFHIIWGQGKLGLRDPFEGSVRHLEPADEPGTWTIEDGKKAISFLLDGEGNVISLSADVGTTFVRQAPVAIGG